MKKLMLWALLLGGLAAFADGGTVSIDELSPYAKGQQNDYWDTSSYTETVVTRASTAAFNPLGGVPASGVNGSVFDCGIYCVELSNLLDVCADPAAFIIIIR